MLQATGKTAAEIHRMGHDDRYLTALLHARYLREKGKEAKKAQRKGKR